MPIRGKLLMLVIFLGAALLVNLLALGFLARSVTVGLQQIETVDIRQQVRAVHMQAGLRDAEAALYRYLIEGESGYREQFESRMAEFAADVADYAAQADNTAGRNWTGELTAAHDKALSIGLDLIQGRDQQIDDFTVLSATQNRLTTLLDTEVRPAQPADPAFQSAITGMQDSLRALAAAVTSYLTAPTALESVDFTDTVVNFRRHELAFEALAVSPEEQAWVAIIHDSFGQISDRGLSLLNSRSEQDNRFAAIAATLYHTGQEILVNEIQPQAARNLARTEQQLQTALNIAIGSSLFVALLSSMIAIIVTWPLVRRMDTGIQALLHGAQRVAEGDLSEPVSVLGDDELAQLSTGFNGMMADLATRQTRLQARLSELEALRRISLELTGTLDISLVLGTIVHSAQALVKAAEVRLFVFDADRGQLTFSGDARSPDAQHRMARPLRDEGITAQVARTGVATVIDYAQHHPLFDTPEAQAWGIQAAAALPLSRGEQVLGVLNISLADRPAFSEDDLRILDLLSDQASIALENARLYENLRERESRLQSLITKLSQIQEEERRLIGLDLHDGLTQLLLSANMHLDTLASSSGSLPAQAEAELTLTQSRLRQAIDEARWVVSELRPAALEGLGLVAGLSQYAADVGQLEGWQMEFSADLGAVKLSPSVEAALFRIAQEALTNVRKYASTQRVRVDLRTTESHVILTVQDWGRGFDSQEPMSDGRHFGLEGMQERAAVLGGQLQIESTLGTGTQITARVPLFAMEAV